MKRNVIVLGKSYIQIMHDAYLRDGKILNESGKICRICRHCGKKFKLDDFNKHVLRCAADKFDKNKKIM